MEKLTQKFASSNKKIYTIVVLVAVFAGLGTGYYLSNSSPISGSTSAPSAQTKEPPKNAAQDTQTFKDWGIGTLKKKPEPKKNDAATEGTHILVLENGQNAALTSSVVDLSQYEGKRVKVYGQTYNSKTSAWLMDVGKVEVQ